ncbi:PKD domain-containing protein [Humisphaera borealis]|uniref:PKD domain-containing protein n=1 Tax=Humisphaera borealis TaxID=2807512 RepID=A0A7M2X3G7_9BACT|nr:PKD domain-containing protein [Humisphaera borealis]QOV92169.1 PKD domain-containing protein [Humisphaera borealis]
MFGKIRRRGSSSAPTPASICSIEPLEDRVLYALAKTAGGSGYSGTLSTNTAIKKQQLISDPDEPIAGSTSVQYNPALVHLSGAIPGPGYNNSYFKAVVEVSVKTKCCGHDDDDDRRRNSRHRHNDSCYTYKKMLQPLTSFLTTPWGTETGYAQVSYKLTGTAGQIAPPSGYNIQDEGGVSGVDTHAFFFDVKTTVPANAVMDYQIFAAVQNTFSNNTQDFLQTADGTILGPNDLTPAFVSTQTAPTITTTGGPYSISEGSGVTLSATATDVETPGSLTYAWDLNGDSVTDVTGANPTLSASALAALGLGDGPLVKTVTLTVSDGQKDSTATTTLTIGNAKPTAGVTSTAGSVVAPAGATLTATDPSAADQAAGFTFLVDWGDGTDPELIAASANNGSGTNATHQYALGGTYTVTALATDKDGGLSDVASTTVTVANEAPTVSNNGGPYSISEGDGITLLASANDAETPGSLTYAWDINGDDVTDATGANPTLSAAALATLGLGDGPTNKAVTLKVSDGQNTVTSTTTLAVNNVAPTAGATATPGTIIAPAGLSLTASDAAAADNLAGFTFQIDWGDGSPLETIAASGGNGSGTNASHQYNLSGTFTASVTATDKDGGTSLPVTASVLVVNTAPTITSDGGAYSISEGAGVTLLAAATDLETPGSLNYLWDLNGDLVIDATGANPTLSAAALATLGLGDGPTTKAVRLTVSDGENVVTSDTTITVNNVAPTAGASATSGSLSTPVVLSLTATDASLADRAAGFKFLIDWGDGTPVQTVLASANNGSGINVAHAYALIGPFTVSVTAVDKDGASSTPTTTETGVSGAQLRPDPSNPSVNALFVYGTNGNDNISFSQSRYSTIVYMNGQSLGSFNNFCRIIARSIGGNDCISMSYCASTPIVFYGGDGNDRLISGNTNGIMDGGAGDDYLDAGNGKDLLIGGLGADTLYGGNCDDIMVAGRTSFDAGTDDDIRAVTKLLNEWMGSQSYETKISRLTGVTTGGLNGTILLKPGVTVFDDGVVDKVYGGRGRDWFLVNRTGGGVLDIVDLANNETVTDL